MKFSNKKKLAWAVLLIMLISPITSFAQGGLFGYGKTTTEASSLSNGGMSKAEGGTTINGDGFSNQTFGQNEEPLGSGLAILVAAGAGYALIRRKKND